MITGRSLTVTLEAWAKILLDLVGCHLGIHRAGSGRMWYQDAAVREGREMAMGNIKCITLTLEKQI